MRTEEVKYNYWTKLRVWIWRSNGLLPLVREVVTAESAG